MDKLRGAYFVKNRGYWKSCVVFKGINFHLGYFTTGEKAHEAHMKAKAYLESLKPGDEHYKYFEQKPR